MGLFQNFFSKPYSTMLTITSDAGLHLRPAAAFVAKTKGFSCNVTALFENRSVNAKNVTELLSLNLQKGDIFTLITEGKDAENALDILARSFKGLMYNTSKPTAIKKESHPYESSVIEGDIIAKGVAIAPLYLLSYKETYTPNETSFDEAIAHSFQELQRLYDDSRNHNDIYLAQQTLLTELAEKSSDLESFTKRIKKHIKKLQGKALESKIIDYKDILKRVKKHLGYGKTLLVPKTPFILVAQDLLPSEISSLESSQVQGVILTQTSTTSHTAILLRSAGITSIALHSELTVEENEVAILDATCAVCLISPETFDIEKAKEQQQLITNQKAKSQAKRLQHALTHDNIKINVLANIQDMESAKIAQEEGAEGIGLLRTEFLFKKKEPSFEKQHTTYQEIFALYSNIIVRTLDVGGDKKLPYISLPKEKNPFLGIRGVRLFKTHRSLLEEQLHAILLAAENRPIKVMFPMVSTIEEFIQAKEIAKEVANKHTIPISNIKFGIMIEVPSVLFLLQDFNEVVDFYSIGTNDLTQYLFATDRAHLTLKVNPLSPVIFSVLKEIKQVVTKPISICGELASHPQAIPQLIKLGFRTLSVNPIDIPDTKQEIRNA